MNFSPITKRIMAAAVAAAVPVSMVLIPYFEGNEPVPYYDGAHVATVCIGHTGNVDIHRTYTKEECQALFMGDRRSAEISVDKLVKVPVDPLVREVLISFVFNFGEGKFRNSTLLRRINAGEGKAACDELPRWIHVAGVPSNGLITRRGVEREICIMGYENAVH